LDTGKIRKLGPYEKKEDFEKLKNKTNPFVNTYSVYNDPQ
jgi:hypothetical protein